MGVDNIKYAQMDILETGSWGERFDIIECGGVLHHMDDPIAGWEKIMRSIEPRWTYEDRII